MKITGKVTAIGELRTSGQDNNFKNRAIMVDCTTEHMGMININHLQFEFEQDNVAKLDAIKVGDTVTVDCFPQGRYYEKDNERKHWQYLRSWDIAVVPATATA